MFRSCTRWAGRLAARFANPRHTMQMRVCDCILVGRPSRTPRFPVQPSFSDEPQRKQQHGPGAPPTYRFPHPSFYFPVPPYARCREIIVANPSRYDTPLVTPNRPRRKPAPPRAYWCHQPPISRSGHIFQVQAALRPRPLQSSFFARFDSSRRAGPTSSWRELSSLAQAEECPSDLGLGIWCSFSAK